MRITHYIQDIHPRSGGPPAVVIDLSRQQMVRGHEVTIVCGEKSDVPEIARMLDMRWADLHRRPTIVAPGYGRATARFLRDAISESKPEVVHTHGVFSLGLNTVTKWSDRHGVPCVCSTHGMLHPSALALKSVKKNLFLTLFPKILRSPRWLLTLNAEEEMNARLRFNSNCCVMENGIHVESFTDTTPSEFLDANPVLRDRPYALFVGRLHSIKGIDNLIRAFACARARGLREELVIMGPEEGWLAQISQAIDSCAVKDKVHILPPAYGSAKASAIAGCTMFVHRPRYEGFGIAVAEAMAAGRPVVTTKRCHLDRAFTEGVIIPAEDTDEGFASAMLDVGKSSDAASERGRRNAEWAKANLAWDSIAARIERLYSGK
jgi:glycosyltransferase involved in cell wall biosynthesis